MTDPCPSNATLQAFAAGGGLDDRARPGVAAHIRGCAKCQAAFLPIALHTSALQRTAFDSPRAQARSTSRDVPLPQPATC